MLSTAQIEELLEQREGRALDFKEGQYSFDGASDEAKSELLKDILAFANTERMHDAYILIGVREVKDGPSVVVGISTHLDDANLQQFINSKTNRKILFSYEATTFDGLSIGVIHIPVGQSRPIWSAKSFGRVERNIVYVRSGSSTAIASPDDIASMGAARSPSTSRRPNLSFSFFSRETEECSTSMESQRTFYRMPDDDQIEDYHRNISINGQLSVLTYGHDNRNYYRQVASYVSQRNLIVPLCFCIENLGDGPASDVVIHVRVNSTDSATMLLEARDLKDKPTRDTLSSIAMVPRSLPTSIISRNARGSLAIFSVPKVLAGERHVLAPIVHLHSTISSTVAIEVSVLAHELSAPLLETLTVKVEVKQVDVSPEQLYRHANKT